MKPLTALLMALSLGAADAHGFSVDARKMARFDLSYVACEARIPEMHGHRDEAWLALWRVKVDPATRAQLAAVRQGAVYRDEQRRIQQAAAKGAAPAASATLDGECRALWGETQRMLQTKP